MCNVASTIARAHLSSDRKAAKRYLELAWIDGAFASCNSAITDVVSIVGSPEQVAFAKASLEANVRDPAKLAARARFDIFQAAVAAGRHASLECRELADRAAAGFRELGMPIDEAWSLECGSRTDLAAAVYERIGAKAEARRLTGAVAPADVEVSASLTSREEQVCRLIASGLTNREAAARLSIGARTTETHLANAYRKLGLRSRAELAARFGR